METGASALELSHARKMALEGCEVAINRAEQRAGALKPGATRAGS